MLLLLFSAEQLLKIVKFLKLVLFMACSDRYGRTHYKRLIPSVKTVWCMKRVKATYLGNKCHKKLNNIWLSDHANLLTIYKEYCFFMLVKNVIKIILTYFSGQYAEIVSGNLLFGAICVDIIISPITGDYSLILIFDMFNKIEAQLWSTSKNY